jgi:hypothetical protein
MRDSQRFILLRASIYKYTRFWPTDSEEASRVGESNKFSCGRDHAPRRACLDSAREPALCVAHDLACGGLESLS